MSACGKRVQKVESVSAIQMWNEVNELFYSTDKRRWKRVEMAAEYASELAKIVAEYGWQELGYKRTEISARKAVAQKFGTTLRTVKRAYEAYPDALEMVVIADWEPHERTELDRRDRILQCLNALFREMKRPPLSPDISARVFLALARHATDEDTVRRVAEEQDAQAAARALVKSGQKSPD